MAKRPDELIGAWKAPAYASVDMRDVRVFYGNQVVLHNLNLRLEAGSSTALMGANGAGKSTALRVLSSLLTPHAGEVCVGDALTLQKHAKIIRPTIGLVAHEPMLYEDLSATENLTLWAKLYDLQDARVEDWLDVVQLAHVGERRVSGFSRGMKQRLALARALLHQPTLILLDEVLTGLDLASRHMVWDTLAALRHAGRIIVMASHIFDHPAEAVTRGVVLRSGRVFVDGAASQGLLSLYQKGTATVVSRGQT